MQDILEQLFPERMALRKQGKCPECATTVDKAALRDPLSKKEFEISGLCQRCQDDFFGAHIGDAETGNTFKL